MVGAECKAAIAAASPASIATTRSSPEPLFALLSSFHNQPAYYKLMHEHSNARRKSIRDTDSHAEILPDLDVFLPIYLYAQLSCPNQNPQLCKLDSKCNNQCILSRYLRVVNPYLALMSSRRCADSFTGRSQAHAAGPSCIRGGRRRRHASLHYIQSNVLACMHRLNANHAKTVPACILPSSSTTFFHHRHEPFIGVQ